MDERGGIVFPVSFRPILQLVVVCAPTTLSPLSLSCALELQHLPDFFRQSRVLRPVYFPESGKSIRTLTFTAGRPSGR